MIKKFIRKIFGNKPKTSSPSDPKAQVFSVKQHGIRAHHIPENARFIISTLEQNGYQAYIVGGAVRDLLLKLNPKDIDIATNATPEQIKRLFRRAFIIGKRFRIVHIVFGKELFEITTFRGNHSHHTTNEHGRILQDNHFGTHHEDATRRDFTINALYYNPTTEKIIDYHHGMADIQNKILRIIGDPVARYREDPVRMLRAIRLTAKLHLTLDPQSHRPIKELAPLISHIPPARIFDELLKFLQSGQALKCLTALRQTQLHHELLPWLEKAFTDPQSNQFIGHALNATDQRIQMGKSISPSFLFATLLWHEVLPLWELHQKKGEHLLPALHLAIDDVLEKQSEKLAIQKKFSADMREIWSMQPRFLRRTGRAPFKLIIHPRLRAGYDFLLLRCQSNEIPSELGTWWTQFIEADDPTREKLLQNLLPSDTNKPKRKRRPTRHDSPKA